MPPEQQPNCLGMEEKVSKPILRRCSDHQNKSQPQSDDLQQQRKLQYHICPPQAKQYQMIAERAGRPTKITNITLQQKTCDLTVSRSYTDAKRKEKGGMIFDLFDTCGLFILTNIFVYFCANGEKTNALFWELAGHMEKTLIEVEWVCISVMFVLSIAYCIML